MPRTPATNLQLRRRVASRLRQARINKGLSQEQLAEAMRISAETVSRFERAQLAVSLELLSRASRALGVPIEVVVGQGPAGISAKEAELVEGFRQLGSRGQQALLELVRCWCATQAGGQKVR